ncbi:MAG: TrmH family RNA methyltransferase [Saprospiraceae bacterium]
MISKNKIKQLQQLSSKKQRVLRGEFLVEGPKLFEEAANNGWEVLEVFATEEYVARAQDYLKELKLFIVEAKDLQKIGNLESNKYVAALVKIKNRGLANIDWQNNLSLVLDDIKDPGNMGTILRTASWFGIKNIYCSDNCVDMYNAKVVQASMGSIFSSNVVQTDVKILCKEASNLVDFPIFGAFMDGQAPKTINQCKKGFLVLGSESHGVSTEIEQYITTKINIAKSPGSDTESLNVAIANAILCYELTRE